MTLTLTSTAVSGGTATFYPPDDDGDVCVEVRDVGALVHVWLSPASLAVLREWIGGES
jgi:hypothetical protein